MHNLSILLTFAGSLAAALVLGFLAHRLKVSPIVGYLLAGIAVGPFTPGFVADRAIAEQFAEIGVILLLFVEWILGLVGLSLTMNVRERFQQVGFVLVLLLMGFVIINDFVGLGERWFSKPAVQEQQKK